MRRSGIDDDDLSIYLVQRLPYQRCIFRIDDQNLGASMQKRESDIRGIEAGIQWIGYSSKHRYRKIRFDHLRNLLMGNPHGIEPFYSNLCQARYKPENATKDVPIAITTVPPDHT